MNPFVSSLTTVRMLLKSGYKGVYVSRTFALKSGLIPAKVGLQLRIDTDDQSSLGTSGYVGLVSCVLILSVTATDP